MTINEDKNFISKCSMLGIQYRSVTRFNGNVTIRVANSNLYVFMNNNYDVIGIEPALDLGSALKKMEDKVDLYGKKIDCPYLNGLSLQDISEINNRVNFMRYDKIQVNNYFYPLPNNSEILNLIGLLKFVNVEMHVYFRNIYPLILAGCDVKYDFLEFIRGVFGKVWDLVQANPNVSALDVLNGIGQNNFAGIEGYLKYVVELLKNPFDKDYSTHLLRILDFPYDKEKAIKDSYKLFSEMPIRSFNELVQDLESNKPQR